MDWAMRRRLLFLFLFLVLIGGVAFSFVYPALNKAPTCTDGQQNGDEVGVDCGGSCINFCAVQIKEPTILWARSFPVTDSVYNAMGYIENKNDAAVQALPYEFRLYDTNDVLVARADGTANIPPLGRYAIVETGIQVGNVSIARTTLIFSKNPALWQKVPAEIKSLRVSTSNSKFDDSGAVPKLVATLGNASSFKPLVNTTIVAVLYDVDGNAINVSKTMVPLIRTNDSVSIFFTWPKAFTAKVVRSELIPMIDVFSTR